MFDTAETVLGETAGDTGPVSLFQGTNSVMGTGLSKGVVEGTSTMVSGVSEVRYRVCYDSASLSRTLDITQSANLGFGVFGASEKMELMSSARQTTHSINLVVYVRHVTGIETADEWRLVPGMAPPKTDEEKRDFFRVHGDAFISALERGSEYYAVYSFYAQSQEEQETLKMEMAAQGIFESGSFGADFQRKISAVSSKTKIHFSFDQLALGVKKQVLPVPERAVEFALAFPGIEPDSPVIIRCTATGYERVLGFGDGQPIAANRDYFIGNGVTPGVCKDFQALKDLSQALDSLRKIHAAFGGYPDEKVEAVWEEALRDQKALEGQVSRYLADPLGRFDRPDLPALAHGSPLLQYTAGWSESWGGGGADGFDDVAVSSFLQSVTRIESIQLRRGSEVDAIATTYSNAERTWTQTHGGDGGGLGPALLFLEGERVVRIDGRCGAHVDQLRITTSRGHTVDGGGDGGGPFSWTVPEGAVILGFRGASDNRLVRIQAVYAVFEPTAWVT